MKSINFLLAGVGGQGTILASDVLAAVGLHSGHDVKKSEVHGMAQRGGSVTTYDVAVKGAVFIIIGPGEADFYLAFEKLETLRYVEMLRPGGTVLVNDYTISPLSVSSGNDVYPDDERVKAIIGAVTPHLFLLPATALAEELGNARVNNVVLLGALSYLIPEVPTAVWVEAIRERVPVKFADLNERAFVLGQETMRQDK